MTEINPINTGNSEYKKSNNSQANPNDTKCSIFTKYDLNGDNKITTEELIKSGYSENEAGIINQSIFSAERAINKWFKVDRDVNGIAGNLEMKRWDEYNNNAQIMSGDLTNTEYAIKYGLKVDDKAGINIEKWLDDWINDNDPMCGIKIRAEQDLGRKLTDEEISLLYESAKIQMNNWLFKTDFSLYERANIDAYTRLITHEQSVSCCGGDTTSPPDAGKNACSLLFRGMDSADAVNDSTEVKTRLAWATFKTLPKEQTDKMSDEEYAQYQQQWFNMKNMTAADYRELLKPENIKQRAEFEQNSNMTVAQILDYVDIIESTTGKDFDSSDWEINAEQWYSQVCAKVNGTYNETGLLDGKTRADIPPERQNLLKYLESNDLLLDQFK